MTDDKTLNDSDKPRRYRVTRIRPTGGLHALLYPNATMSRIEEVAPGASLPDSLNDTVELVDAGTPLTDWKDDVN